MAYSVKNMLYLADLYFSDGKGTFRFQWTTKAFDDGLSKPIRYDDCEYYQMLSKYQYRKEHLNDGSKNAASFRVTVYDKTGTNVVRSETVDGTDFDAEFKLDAGEYLWDVAALDASGKVITVSEKSYVNTNVRDNGNNEISYSTSSSNHLVAYAGEFWNDHFRACTGKIISGDDEAYFNVCGQAEMSYDEAWDHAQENGYTFSVSNAFNGFSGEFLTTSDCLVTCGGIYEYENGQWNYKMFTSDWMSGVGGETNYVISDGGKIIYEWSTEKNTFVVKRTAKSEIYYCCDWYYVTKDGVFSIATGEQVLKYKVAYGENPIFNDMFFNIYAKKSSGAPQDVLAKGKTGSVVVKYFLFNSETGEIVEQEMILFEGKAPVTYDTEEIFATRIGDCICYRLQDESDDDMDPQGRVVVHKIGTDGTITSYELDVRTEDDIEFSINASGNLVCTYRNESWHTVKYDFGIKVNTVMPETSDIILATGNFSEVDLKETNNWDDIKYAGAEGCVEKLPAAVTEKGDLIRDRHVGEHDSLDYYEFSLENAAKLSLSVNAGDAAKIVIYELVAKTDRKGNVSYSLKARQSTALKKAKDAVDYTALSKGLLLDKGTYYIGVQSTNAKKGGSADYSVSVDGSSIFYTEGDNSDDWSRLKTAGAAGDVGSIGVIDSSGTVIANEWVGYGDAWDYQAFTLNSAAKLSFSVNAGDAAKIVIYKLVSKTDRNGNTTYSLKALQTTSLKKAKGAADYTALTKGLLLDADTYYIGVQSTNAKKGGNADYSVTVDSTSTFYIHGDEGDDNWLYDKKQKIFNSEIEHAGTISKANALNISGDSAWVGYGDEWDHYEFGVNENMKVSFSVSSSDAVKFMVYQIVDGKSKTLLTTTVKAGSMISTKVLDLLSSGEYYIGIQSTNAKKGGNANYTITGAQYIKPVELALGGISESKLEKYEDKFYNDWILQEEYNWDFNAYIVDQLQDEGILTTQVNGTDGHDIVQSTKGKYCFVNAIDLGSGNDQIIVKSGQLCVSGGVDLGDGNDVILLEKNCDFEAEDTVDLGSGNDQMTVKAGSDGFEVNEIRFGAGDDKLVIEKITEEIRADNGIFMEDGDDTVWIDSVSGYSNINYLDLGADDDTLVINNDSALHGLDFGTGFDTLDINGTVSADYISDLEKISGRGTLAVRNIASAEDLADLCKDAGIDLVCAGKGFTTREKEVMDNSRENAVSAIVPDDVISFWLESAESAAEKGEFGCTDTVDWFKIDTRKIGSEDEITIWTDSTVTCTMYDPRGREQVLYCSGGEGYCIDDWSKGVYYFKFEVAKGCSGTGSICIDD